MRGANHEGFHTNPAMPNALNPPPTYPIGGSGSGGRKKGMGLRPWYVLHSSGQSQITEAGKQTIMRRTGIPARDLRILDPLLSYPSTVLGREKAIVINLEHIKAIITAHEVLLLNSNDPSVSPFINELQRRILCHHQATKPREEDNYEAEAHTRTSPCQGEAVTPKLSEDQGSEAKKDVKQILENQDGSKILPFEFVALEACLESASSSLEHEALRLGLEANPALDKLTSKINTLNLERVRQIKSRLVAITGRVQKVRDELEHLLNDDEDMAAMYLTKKLAHKLESDNVEVDLPEDEDEDIGSALRRNRRRDHTSSMSNKLNVQELEMLLEAYFVQIDGTLNKLSTLREYVDDTEDYLNINLDDKQNHLLQMSVKLASATLVISAFVAVAGVFGMNINIELFNDDKAGPGRFLWTVVGSFLASLFFYFSFNGWCKNKRLLD